MFPLKWNIPNPTKVSLNVGFNSSDAVPLNPGDIAFFTQNIVVYLLFSLLLIMYFLIYWLEKVMVTSRIQLQPFIHLLDHSVCTLPLPALLSPLKYYLLLLLLLLFNFPILLASHLMGTYFSFLLNLFYWFCKRFAAFSTNGSRGTDSSTKPISILKGQTTASFTFPLNGEYTTDAYNVYVSILDSTKDVLLSTSNTYPFQSFTCVFNLLFFTIHYIMFEVFDVHRFQNVDDFSRFAAGTYPSAYQ